MSTPRVSKKKLLPTSLTLEVNSFLTDREIALLSSVHPSFNKAKITSDIAFLESIAVNRWGHPKTNATLIKCSAALACQLNLAVDEFKGSDNDKALYRYLVDNYPKEVFSSLVNTFNDALIAYTTNLCDNLKQSTKLDKTQAAAIRMLCNHDVAEASQRMLDVTKKQNGEVALQFLRYGAKFNDEFLEMVFLAINNNSELVALLFKKKLDPNYTFTRSHAKGKTLLVAAIERYQLDTVQQILRQPDTQVDHPITTEMRIKLNPERATTRDQITFTGSALMYGKTINPSFTSSSAAFRVSIGSGRR